MINKIKKEIYTPSKDELEELRETMTREQLSEHYNVSVSQIKRWITQLGVSKKTRGSNGKEKISLSPVELNFDSGLPAMEKAKIRLGDRMEIRRGSYWLDGRPASSDKILKEAKLSSGSR